MRIRFRTNVVSGGVDYRPGDVADLGTQAAANYITAGFAIAEGPSLVSVVTDAYEGAGYVELTPDPSGYVGPSGHVADAPSGGGYVVNDDDSLTIVFPGRRATTFDILKMRPLL